MALYENALGYNAAENLLGQMQEIGRCRQYGTDASRFYKDLVHDSVTGVVVHRIKDGEDAGKLTLLETTADGEKGDPVPGIKPADFENLIQPGECLADTVTRLRQEAAQKPKPTQ